MNDLNELRSWMQKRDEWFGIVECLEAGKDGELQNRSAIFTPISQPKLAYGSV
jgi:hypothetical protein